MFEIILFYKYIKIEQPNDLKKSQLEICQKLNLKGRMIVAREGINATLEGTKQNIKKYLTNLKSDLRFKDADIKKSPGTGESFPKLSVKVRNEIVALELQKDLDPNKVSGKYLEAAELKAWIEGKKEFFIVDMRNDYEQIVGQFENSILLGLKNFRDLPSKIKSIKNIKDKTIVSVCTGGVRCEKASGFLVREGFSNVYQLKNGIVTYMKKYPGQDFKGSLYVFDNRIVMGFDKNHQVIGGCEKCKTHYSFIFNTSEHYINCKDDVCHRHFILCEKCCGRDESAYCPKGCKISRRGDNINV